MAQPHDLGGGGVDIGQAGDRRVGPIVSFGASHIKRYTHDATVDLAAVAQPSLAGGTFSGPGVTNGELDPAALLPGTYDLTYTVAGDAEGGNAVATLPIVVQGEARGLRVSNGQDYVANDYQTTLREAVQLANADAAAVGFGVDEWVFNGSTFTRGDALTLTTNRGGEAGSAWMQETVSVTDFTASFTYRQDCGNDGADGFTSTLQGNGAHATGAPGGGTNGVTIDGPYQFRRHFFVDTNASLTLDQLTIQDGHGYGRGGAILSNGQLDIRNSLFVHNTAQTDGGAIATNAGSTRLHISNSTFVDNFTFQRGGVFWIEGGDVVLDHLTIVDNSASAGHANLAFAAPVKMTNSVVARN